MLDDLDINNDDQEVPLFCSTHREKGCLLYKHRGMEGLKVKGKKSATNMIATKNPA